MRALFQNSILSKLALTNPGKDVLTLPIVNGTELILLFKFNVEVPDNTPFIYTFVVPSFINTTEMYIQLFKEVFGKISK